MSSSQFTLSNFYDQQTELLKTKFNIPESESRLLSTVQRDAIVDGIPVDVVKKITPDQLHFVVKYGLSKEEVNTLNYHQIQAYLNLRHTHKNLLPFLQQHSTLNNGNHLSALGFLVTKMDLSVAEAFNILNKCSQDVAKAIGAGFMPETILDPAEENDPVAKKINQLFTKHFQHLITQKEEDEVSIKELIAAKQIISTMFNSDKFLQLNTIQKNLFKEFYYWGATTELIQKCDWIKTTEQQLAITYLMHGLFFNFEQAALEIKDLNEVQLGALTTHGLLKKEVENLNNFQLMAVIRIATFNNKLCSETFKDKPWFKSEEHVRALTLLHKAQGFSIAESFKQLENSTQEQLIQSQPNTTVKLKYTKSAFTTFNPSLVVAATPKTVAPESTAPQTKEERSQPPTSNAPHIRTPSPFNQN